MRRLPCAPPFSSESLASWILTLSNNLDIPIWRIPAIIGFGSHPFNLFQTGRWPRKVSPRQVVAIRNSTGLHVSRIIDMTFNHLYSGIPSLELADGSRSMWRYNFIMSQHVRICPEYLRERPSRWPLVWHLPWVIACQMHIRYLVDSCKCGAPVKTPASTRGDWICHSLDPMGCGRPLHSLPSSRVRHRELISAQAKLIEITRRKRERTSLNSATADDLYNILLMTLARGSLASIPHISESAKTAYERFSIANERDGWQSLISTVARLPADRRLLEAAILMSEPILTADQPLEAARSILPLDQGGNGLNAMSDWVHSKWQVEALLHGSHRFEQLTQLCLGSASLDQVPARGTKRYSGWRSPVAEPADRRRAAKRSTASPYGATPRA
ncbi:TniQ family protein [Kitasatospora sp. NPDC004614]|uniref:TniQ family protein n=1 Tax=unclassified Kitasatospora TaxID=2633591 RepID=UPI0036994712